MTISVVERLYITYDLPSMNPLMMGKLELDIDPLAERHCVMDRNTGAVFHIGKNDINIHYLPEKYAINSNLLVLIFDDDRTFNAAVADGVKCELINLATV